MKQTRQESKRREKPVLLPPVLLPLLVLLLTTSTITSTITTTDFWIVVGCEGDWLCEPLLVYIVSGLGQCLGSVTFGGHHCQGRLEDKAMQWIISRIACRVRDVIHWFFLLDSKFFFQPILRYYRLDQILQKKNLFCHTACQVSWINLDFISSHLHCNEIIMMSSFLSSTRNDDSLSNCGL